MFDLLLALILGGTPVHQQLSEETYFTTIFFRGNGVHVGLVLGIEDLSDSLRLGLQLKEDTRFLSFEKTPHLCHHS